MIAVAGIDPSLTATAACVIRDGDVQLRVSETKPNGPTALAKLDRMHRQTRFAAATAASVDLVLVEGPSLSSKGSATRDLAGLWWLMYELLLDACPAVGMVPPSSLKKWATGKGNADKFVVGQHIGKRWPSVVLGSNDEADALGIASMGLHHVGALPWEPTAYQREAMEKVEWTKAALALAGAARAGAAS